MAWNKELIENIEATSVTDREFDELCRFYCGGVQTPRTVKPEILDVLERKKLIFSVEDEAVGGRSCSLTDFGLCFMIYVMDRK